MSKQILIIEDDFETQFLFSELLEAEGHKIQSAASGTEATGFLQDGGRPDVILMDLNFPGGTPEDFVKSVRDNAATKETPIVLISGKADIAEYAGKLGAHSYFKKPFDLDQVIDLIQNGI